MKFLTLFTVILVLIYNGEAAPSTIFCYYESWATYTLGIQDINANICTHLLYAFVGITEDANIRIDDYDSSVNNGGFVSFTNLKAQNPNLKTLISIGGWSEGSETFSHVATDPGLRDVFASNVVRFLLDYGFDGVDIDWEYPADRGGASSDYTNYVELLWALRAQLSPYGFLLTAAVGAGVGQTDSSYDLGRMRDVLDYANLMTYDFHGSWESVTGANAPLYAKASEADKSSNVDAAVQRWLSLGFPAEKLVVGLGAYGHQWTLNDPNDHVVGSPGVGSDNPPSYTSICQQDWSYGWDNEQIIVYAWRESDRQWVGFDNADSIGYKTDYAIQNNLGGLMIWSIDQDDPWGSCGSPYPLLNSVRNHLGWVNVQI